jgi:hypothetical protein
MKKVVRTVWISLLTGLAFLVACTSPKGLTRAEKKQLKAERTALITQIDQQRHDCEGVTDPDVLLQFRSSEYSLRSRLSEINSKLGDTDAQAENGQQMGIIVTEIDSLRAVISSKYEYEVLYGVPTVDPIQEQEMKNQRRKELQEQLDQLMQAIQRRETSCVYGSPEIIQRYGEETRRMRQQAEDIQQQIKELDEDGNKSQE